MRVSLPRSGETVQVPDNLLDADWLSTPLWQGRALCLPDWRGLPSDLGGRAAHFWMPAWDRGRLGEKGKTAITLSQGKQTVWMVGNSQAAQLWRIHLPMQETQRTRVQSPGWEDALEEQMATTAVSVPREAHGQRTWRATVRGVIGAQTRPSRVHAGPSGTYCLPTCLSADRCCSVVFRSRHKSLGRDFNWSGTCIIRIGLAGFRSGHRLEPVSSLGPLDPIYAASHVHQKHDLFCDYAVMPELLSAW